MVTMDLLKNYIGSKSFGKGINFSSTVTGMEYIPKMGYVITGDNWHYRLHTHNFKKVMQILSV